MRILGLLAEYPAPEFERRAAAIRAAASPGVEVEVDVVPGNVFRAGMTDLHRSLIAPIITRAALDVIKQRLKVANEYYRQLQKKKP